MREGRSWSLCEGVRLFPQFGLAKAVAGGEEKGGAKFCLEEK
jgi:hypothetical protein